MEASIKEPNIRNFTRLLQCASRFGDDLNISANKDIWEMAVTNSSKSAFCLFKLHPSFFCRYKALGTPPQQRKGVKCQVLVKSALAVLGKASSITNVERLDLKIDDPENSLRSKRRRTAGEDSTAEESQEERKGGDYGEGGSRGREAILIMKLVCRHGVTKKHSLHLGSSDFLRADVDPDSTPSGFIISARTLRDWLDHFSISQTTSSATTTNSTTTIKQENQLSWMFAKDEVRVKSWEGGGGTRELSTEIKVDKKEFDDYEVFDERVDLTLPMREFRATLALAEQLSIRLVVAFSQPFQPLTLSSEPPALDEDDTPWEIFCAIATTSCDQFTNVPAKPPGAGSNGSRDVKPSRTASMTSASQSAGGSGSGYRSRVASAGPSRGPSLSVAPGDPRESQRPGPNRRAGTLSLSVSQAGPGPGPSRIHASSQHNGHNGHGNEEPLFLPSGSQSAGASGGGGGLGSQLSQREVMDISGFGDIDPEQLMDEMDDTEHQEALDAEAEATAEAEAEAEAQAETSGRRAEPADETGAGTQRRPLAELDPGTGPVMELELELDQSIFPPSPARSAEEDAAPIPATQHPRRDSDNDFETFFDD